MIIDIQVIPSPAGTADVPYAYVDAAIAVIAESGLKHTVHALGTTVESDSSDSCWEVARQAFDAALAAGATSEIMFLKVYSGDKSVDDLESSGAAVSRAHRPEGTEEGQPMPAWMAAANAAEKASEAADRAAARAKKLADDAERLAAEAAAGQAQKEEQAKRDAIVGGLEKAMRPRSKTAIEADQAEAHKGEMGERLKKAGAKVGALTCSLMWDNANDLDLHCESPTGSHIFYEHGHRKGTCGGHLDVDMNAKRKNSNDKPIENILWEDPPKGHYRFWVEAVDMERFAGATPFKVRLTKEGKSEEKEFPGIEEDEEIQCFEFDL